MLELLVKEVYFTLYWHLYSVAVFSQVHDCVPFPLIKIPLLVHNLRVLISEEVLLVKGTKEDCF